MRIVPFPNQRERDLQRVWLSDLETALHGDGPSGEEWSQLREDVRALAPPMTAEFHRTLQERLVDRGAQPPLADQPSALASAGDGRPRHAREHTTPTDFKRPFAWLKRPGRISARLLRSRLLWAGLCAAATMILVGVVVAPWRSDRTTIEATSPRISNEASLSRPSATGAQSTVMRATGAASATGAPDSGSSAPSGGRVQQLGASLSLAPNPSEVQEVADRVSRVAVSDGGFVQNSQVEVQRTGVSEASLLLRLPSTKLDAALASLGHLAPVRAESQSLQDITGAYDAARRRLADATAERTALLRALSKASTQTQIARLRTQLSEVRDAISQARSGLAALSRRASTTEVAVTIYGTKHSGSEGLTLHKGLHDAARVLLVVLVALMIAAAVLVPGAVVLAALITGGRWWRRYRRERVLNEG